MSPSVFFVPTRSKYWAFLGPDGASGTGPNDRWASAEAKRAKEVAERMFPDVTFILTEDLPASQTYEPGSRNNEIRAALEARTALRLRS